MRLGVLDVGSNTVHFLVVDAHQGGRPLPVFSHKAELQLGNSLEDGKLSRSCALRLRAFVAEALQIAEDKGVEELLDIGGGSLEIAVGIDEVPDATISLPLGAGRLTRDWLIGDPPSAGESRQLRRHVRAEIARRAGEVTRLGPADRAVATSKTFRQLARIAGAAPSGEGPYVRRVVSHADIAEQAKRLAAMSVSERADLPGVSRTRAPQLAAGALAADAAMDLFGLDELEICPWAL